MGNLVEVKVPDIGDFKDVEVIEVLVKAGDAVAREQSLITVESDKASMEIPSSHAGKVKAMRVKLGDKVSEGSVILELEAAESGAAASPPQPPFTKGGSEPRQVASPPFEKGGPGGIPPAPRPTGEALQVTVPDIGDFKDVEVIEVLVRPGDRVNKDQSLITVESDKASMEIPSPAAGLVQSLLVKIGDKVSQGSPIVMLAANEAAAALPSPAPAAPVSAPPAATTSPPSTAYAVDMVARPAAVEPRQPEGAMPHASPSVRKFARELGVDLTQVAGSGPKGRITQDDVREHVKRALAGGARPAAAPVAGAAAGGLNVIPWPHVDFAKFGPVERVEMSRIKKLSGPNLARNWVMIPHVTNHEDADITELEAFRVQLNKENEKSGVKVTMLAFLIKACVAALKKFPDFNSSIAPEGDAIIRKNYWHVGFAADTPNGLVVPVIRDADKKGIFEIAQETAALAAKARDGKLAIGDMQGGTFSISSLGGIGGTYFTPIINAPEVAILGVCRSTTRPVWDGKQFVPRLILPLSLSWDHRVVDGASAARFNAYLASLLADFRRVLL
ncbi:MAG: dihydrolipoyllysine-residue acetyltransferase [Burkholderiaceae bacterium]|nr:dihydrolipoyllysine-residue acetyltransferase [Burkholderiaceae bacterium]